jgi:hypothetical protein
MRPVPGQAVCSFAWGKLPLAAAAVKISSRFGAVLIFKFNFPGTPSTPGTYCERPRAGKSVM